MRTRRLQLLASLAVVLAFVACTLNPQPLPPLDPENTATNSDGGSLGSTLDGGSGAPSSDASMPPADSDAGGDAGGDGGDASDAGDAGDDAGDGGDVSDPG
ncbi:MAG: hypothetical protein BGO98_19455 [Myxococcales bacterium 68-20]|nr:hypothetical protein [Myxococcales bacterium]OJY24795.1 MAG: hypothetical protein BGO98_19455 [Myxococcales bacterium 68-20]